MVKKKRIINRFINSLFCEYRVPRIPVHIHWGYGYLVDEHGDEFFGICVEKGGQAKCIHVAPNDLSLSLTMNVVAHEFVHYLQFLHGRDMSDAQVEKDAESWANVLCGKWIINHKIAPKTGEHCYGIAPIWEVSVDELD